MKLKLFIFTLITFLSSQMYAQVDEDKMGAWYMYIWNTSVKESNFGLQGDIQYRNWNLIGDLEQLLLRAGINYTPKDTPVKLTAGYAHITIGTYGDSDKTKEESRIYQEALLSQKIGNRIYLKHRFRYEQRFVENQDFRTRVRLGLFLTAPFNKKTLDKGAIYGAFYDEIFLNGEKHIGNNQTVETFDANRLYFALGYSISDKLKMQVGYMKQSKNNFYKGQLQLSLHHKL